MIQTGLFDQAMRFARKHQMVDFVDTKDIAKRAKAIYAERLRATLEPNHLNEFVAIEPDLGEYFLGETFSEAVHPTQ